jgi:hypothetical protein
VFYDFNSDTTGDWSKGNSTLSVPNDSVTRYTSTGADSNISKAFNFDGGQNQIIRIRYKVVTGPSGGGEIFYANSQHGYDASYFKSFTLVSDGAWHTLVLDMSSLNAGGTDWIDYNVTLIRFDLTNVSGVAIDIDWISIGGNGYGTQYFENDVAFMNGNVGIGTTSPANLLEVSVAGYGFRHYGDASNYLRTYAGSGYQILDNGTNQFGYFNGKFYVQTSGTDKLTIDTSGNVGIGTTSPGSYDTAKIGGGHKFLNVEAGSSSYAVATLAGNQAASGDRLGYLTFVNNTNSATYKYSSWIGSEAEGSTANQLGGRLIFSTTGDGSTAGPIERMRIASNGVVRLNAYGSGGITGSPTYNLAVDTSGNIIELQAE